MIPAALIALNLTLPAPSCHTTALLTLRRAYNDKQISAIVNTVFPPSAFVICGVTIADGRHRVEVRYGPQQRRIRQT